MYKNGNGEVRMNLKTSLIFASLLLSIPVLSVCSMAEERLTGDITAGGKAVDISRESAKYGEYTGVNHNKLYAVSDVNLSYDAHGSYFLDLKGKNLALEDRSVFIGGGRYGGYRLAFNYDSLPHLLSNTSKTPFDGAGGNKLNLPAGFVRSATTSGMTNLSTNLKDVNLETKREKWALALNKSFGREVDFKASYEIEKKSGTKSLGGTLSTKGNIILPEPVDYITSILRTSAAYTGENAHAQFEYYLSNFKNANNSITWDNPFTGASFPVTARTSLPPSNNQQRFSLSGGVSLPYYTTVSTAAEYGIMKQDESLLPYSNNPSSIVTTPFSRDTAKAEIDVKHFTLNLSSRPVARLGLNAKYKYYSTQNKTPRTLALYVTNDGTGAQKTVTSSGALYNLPYDYSQNQMKFDASYYLFQGTTLKAGYDYETISRSFREINKTKEDTYRANLVSQYFSYASLGANYSFASRRGEDAYNADNVYSTMHTQEYIDTLPTASRFDNNPGMRKFDIADRKRTKYGTNATFFPADNTTVGLYYNYRNDVYGGSELGLKENRNHSYTADATYSPVNYLSFYTFYTKEDTRSRQESRSFAGAAQSSDPNRDWSASHRDLVNTTGLGTKASFMRNKLLLNADYSFSNAVSSITFVTGTALAASKDMPDLRSKLQNLNLIGEYKFTTSLSAGVGYTYERYETANWQTDGVDPGSGVVPYVITLSGSVPSYEAHKGMLFLVYHLGAENL